MGPVIVLVAVVVLVALIVPLVLRLVKHGRGSIRIDLPPTTYGPGDLVQGAVHLEAKKDLGPGPVVMSLVCTEEWWEDDTDSDGHSSRTKRTKEIYRYDVEAAADFSLGAGQQMVVEFALPTPVPPARSEPSSTVGHLVAAVGGLMRSNRDYYWEVEARYDIPGVDLTADRRVLFDYRP